MSKRESILLAGLMFFMGVALGILISPLKGGIGNNSGNTTNNNFGVSDDIEEAIVED